MKIRARRGVCIGVERHLQAGEEADLDGVLVTFLTGIGAVELVPEEPVVSPVELESEGSIPTNSGQESGSLNSSKKKK